ncbi:MAG: hypothetical protein ACOCZV_02110 [Nanoarchaeota archaeon]
MNIISLSLTNIRSYISQTIEFSEGTTLLSGDIGSGKTTILLALEFALFGILRGKTSPSELLRHGEREGTVTLRFSIDGKEISVSRTLKRSGKNIIQAPGTLVVDDVEESLVATELKAKILDLLGYPESLLSRSTNLFRYTVYTPQEQVKAILHESIEERKDIVRKMFAIDKYQRVADNATYYITDLKGRIARLQGQTDDITTLKKQYEAQQKEHSTLVKQRPEIEKQVNSEKEKRKQAEQELEAIRQKKEKLQQQRHELESLKQDIEHLDKSIEMSKRQQATLSESIEQTSIKEIEYDPGSKKVVSEKLDEIRGRKSEFNKRQGELSAKERQAEGLIDKIDELTICPTCKQQVTDEHKKRIREEQQAIIKDTREKIKKLETGYAKLEQMEASKKEEYDKLIAREQHYLHYQKQKQRLDKDKKELDNIKKRIKEQQEQREIITKRYDQKKKAFETMERIDDSSTKKKLDDARAKERQADLTLQDLKSRIQASERMIETLSKAIKEKEEIAREIERLSRIKAWMEELFTPLVKTIEKRIMLKVHNEFNQYFTYWFSQLIEDDLTTVRLDEEFTPLVEQNGFDTSIENLSGGERTSVALSYRLALNKVLNEHFSSLKTTGLLILDEPTDGFSTQQLDTLRDVLEQAGVIQVIIVSHEAKMESLADNLIRIEKQEQKSIIK